MLRTVECTSNFYIFKDLTLLSEILNIINGLIFQNLLSKHLTNFLEHTSIVRLTGIIYILNELLVHIIIKNLLCVHAFCPVLTVLLSSWLYCKNSKVFKHTFITRSLIYSQCQHSGRAQSGPRTWQPCWAWACRRMQTCPSGSRTAWTWRSCHWPWGTCTPPQGWTRYPWAVNRQSHTWTLHVSKSTFILRNRSLWVQ